MMIKELKLTRRKKLLGAIIICALTIAGLTMWYTRPVAEAAILDPHPGLVGWWRFDEESGTIAKDSSSYGNDAAIYGALPVDGKYGKALKFNGIDQYCEVPSSNQINLQEEFTLAAWINTTKVGAQSILGQYGYNKYISLQSNNKLRLNVVQSDGIHLDVISDSVVPTNEWAFVAGTWKKGVGGCVYINGQLKRFVASEKDAWNTIGKRIRFGCLPHTSGDYFEGIIDEVRVYNRSLSQAEIQEIFQKMPDFSSKLLAKIPKGTTQAIITASWQGIGGLNATIESPSESYTEDMVPVYQKISYSTNGGTSEMLNIKRLSISIPALSSDENWYVMIDSDDVEEYTITVEIQK